MYQPTTSSGTRRPRLLAAVAPLVAAGPLAARVASVLARDHAFEPHPLTP